MVMVRPATTYILGERKQQNPLYDYMYLLTLVGRPKITNRKRISVSDFRVRISVNIHRYQ